MNYDALVQETIDAHKVTPVDMLGIGDASGEYAYLNSHRHSYVRTVGDVDGLYGYARGATRVLEIGSFLGAVSVSLKTLGYDVSSLDIPEFHGSASLRALYERNGIRYDGVNLRSYSLPYESESFDVIVICEVIEHLNFNPLPVLKELNRILKQGGHLYIGMPNQSHVVNRVRLSLGRSIHNTIDDYFKQLDLTDNMIVGLHWREYTLPETVEMLGRMGFETTRAYYFTEKGTGGSGSIRTAVKHLLYAYPPFRPYQVVIGRKISVPAYNFWLTAANS